jgi:hypothetical protein
MTKEIAASTRSSSRLEAKGVVKAVPVEKVAKKAAKATKVTKPELKEGDAEEPKTEKVVKAKVIQITDNL